MRTRPPVGCSRSKRPDRDAGSVGGQRLVLCLLVATVVSLGVGRYPAGFGATMGVLFGDLPSTPIHDGRSLDTHFTTVDQSVLLNIRLPRIPCGMLVGAGLAAAAGAGYQTMFRAPLVSPGILAVSAGFAFGGGLIAAALSLGTGRSVGRDWPILLVLGRVVVASVFAALVSMTYTWPIRATPCPP